MTAVATHEETMPLRAAGEQAGPSMKHIGLIGGTIYLVLAVVLTWPWALHPGSTLFGEVIDLQGGIAFLDARIDAGESPFSPGELTAFNLAGGGADIPWQTHLATWPSTLMLTVFGMAFGAIAAYGLFAVIGYVASGLAMLLLLLRLRVQPAMAVLFGALFAFWPFATLSGGIPEFIHTWPLVLVAWRGLELVQAPSWRSGLWLGLAFVLAAFWTPYWLLLGAVLFGTAALVALVAGRREPRASVVALGAACAVALPMLALLYVLSVSGSGTGQVPDRSHTELYAYSARPLDFLTPPADSPVVGERIADWVRERRVFPGSGGPYPLYLGVVVIAGLLAALVLAARRRLPQGAALFLPLLVMGALFSGPPKITLGGVALPLPPLVVYDVVPAWRIYSRVGILVMLAAVVLAALALSRLLEGRGPRVALGVAAALAAVSLADFWVSPAPSAVRPGGATVRVEVPELHERLRELPPGGVVEYPIKSAGHRSYQDIFWQRYHGHPVLGGFSSGSRDEARALEALDVKDPLTYGRLRDLGVRYVVIPRQPVFPSPGPEPHPTDPRFKRVFEDEYGTLYSI